MERKVKAKAKRINEWVCIHNIVIILTLPSLLCSLICLHVIYHKAQLPRDELVYNLFDCTVNNSGRR